MSKTHLFSRLRRALELAARFERLGMSTSEGLERTAAAQWSRRRFLKGSTLTAAGVAAGAMIGARSAAGGQAPRVVIVGGGVAGLTCAFRLQQAGLRPLVIEAGGRPGGRLFTLRGVFPDGQFAELGGEFIDSGHRRVWRLARQLGLTLLDLRAGDGALGRDVYFFDGRRLPLAQVVDEFRPVATRILQDLATIKGDGSVTYLAPNNGAQLDRMSLAEWFDTRDVCGPMRSLLEVAYVGEYGLEAGEQSCLNMLRMIGESGGEFKLFGESDERFRFAGGNDSLPRALAKQLKEPISFETRLEAISQSPSGSYTLTVNQSGFVRELPADEVVLALPFTLLRQVDLRVELPPAKRLAIDTLGYGTNAKLVSSFARRVWQTAGSNGSTYTDLPYQACWESARGQRGAHGLLTNFLGGRGGVELGRGQTETQAAAFVSQINRVFPGAASAFTGQAVRFNWPTAALSRGSFSCYRTGQYSTIAGAEKEPVGGLRFAGEHTRLDYQGFMNGAVESGERAAREILSRVFKNHRGRL